MSILRSAVPLLLLVGCTEQAPPEDAAADPEDTDTNPYDDTPEVPAESATGLAQLDGLAIRNIVVLHADTLRADRLPMYGSGRQTAPNLYGMPYLAVYGYHATAPWTLPSTMTALTALTPEEHGKISMTPGEFSADRHLPEALRDAGFATGSFSGNRVVGSDRELSRGFDEALEIEDVDDVPSQAMASLWAHARTWLDAVPEEEPFFVWLQPMDTHTPHRPEEAWRGIFADYDALPYTIAEDSFTQAQEFSEAYRSAATDEERAAVRQAVLDVYDELVVQEDDTVGALFDWLEASGHRDDTLVVVTADHGETIADDGSPLIGHEGSVRPELVELPLLFYHPSMDGGWTRCLSSNTDLAPTLLRLAGLDPLPGTDGVALQDGCRELTYASLYDVDAETPTLTWLTVADDAYKLDWDCTRGMAALYDLVSDPTTVRPLTPSEVPGADRYWTALQAYLEAARERTPDLACEVGDPPGVAPRARLR